MEVDFKALEQISSPAFIAFIQSTLPGYEVTYAHRKVIAGLSTKMISEVINCEIEDRENLVHVTIAVNGATWIRGMVGFAKMYCQYLYESPKAKEK